MDRDKVINALERCELYGQCEDDLCPYYKGYKEVECLEKLRQDALAMLKEQEVVRCKDCKNREGVHDRVTGYISDDVFFCKNIGYSTRFDFSCADGERKDGVNNES